MATIGSLAVKLSATTVAFERGIQRAEATIGRFNKSISTVALAAKGFVVGLATGAIGLFIKRQFDAVDALGDTAERLGTTAAALAGLEHAAKLADVPIESLHQGLTILNRKLGEAISGSKEVQGGFNKLGLNAEALAALSLDEAFALISERIAALPTEAERAAAAFDVFGKGAGQMATLLRGGGDAIRKATEEARKFGIAPSEAEIARIAEADTAMKRLGAVFTGLGRNLTIGLAPSITEMTERIVAFIDLVRPLILELVEAWSGAWDAIKSVASEAFGGMEISVGSFLTFIKDAFIVSFMAIEFTIVHWRELLELNTLQAFKSLVSFADGTRHFFTEVIPAVLDWFASNWRDIFTTLFDWTFTVFTNLAGNLVEILKNIPGLIAGTVDFSEIWTPLTEGFQTSIRALPDIPERQMTELEKQLQSDISRIQGNLSKEWDAFQSERLGKIVGAAKKAEEAAKPKAPAPKLPLAVTEKKFAGAALRGSSEAISAINKFMAGVGDNGVQQRMLKAAEEANAKHEKQIGLTEELIDAISEDADMVATF